MGLKWVLTTLGLNTLGAAAYAIKVRSSCVWVSEALIAFGSYEVTDSISSSQKGGSERRLIFLVLVISCFISWLFLRVWLIRLGFCGLLIFCIAMPMSVWFYS